MAVGFKHLPTIRHLQHSLSAILAPRGSMLGELIPPVSEPVTETGNYMHKSILAPVCDPIPAAQYVRMSDDGQQYSIENQESANQAYAVQHGFVIVRTYVDAGKSGVLLKHRAGLQELLHDVTSNKVAYQVILVFDVSRWGRFANPDEAAHYEFLCADAGIPIHYCAEPFANDGTLSSSLAKALKRTMAWEFSRELGVKVYSGQRRIAQMGFRVGGSDLYGLRRMVVSADGRQKHTLKYGEWKSIQTDRVILVPGLKKEVKCVRRIFAMAVDGKKPWEIAEQFNVVGIKYSHGRQWTRQAVWRILRNPEYAGYSVWGRSTRHVNAPKKSYPRSEWVTKAGSFVPIVDDGTFQRAQQLIEKRRGLRTDKELLDHLRRLLAKKGRLTAKIINSARGMCDWKTYSSHFGSLPKAYELVGYALSPEAKKASDHCVRMRALQRSVLTQIQELFPNNVRLIRPSGAFRQVIELAPQELWVSLLLCREFRSQGGRRRWMLSTSSKDRENIALVCPMDSGFGEILGYYVMPALRNTVGPYKRLSENDPWFLGGRKLSDLSEFYGVASELAARQMELRC
jgi:DNA invertase Pin-like site-specific DNA recombinase